MSKKFHAEDRKTGQRWKSTPEEKSFLIMYDSGYLGVVSTDGYYTYLKPLDPKKWKIILHKNLREE